MLHVFGVNRGQMMTFDVALAMKKVIDLKVAVKATSGMEPRKQVMLVREGQALADGNKVCSYSAGTESNPIYVFDMSKIEMETFQPSPASRSDDSWSEEISAAIHMEPSYDTVVVRTKLAIRINESTRRQVTTLRSMVHSQRLMFEGWKAAVWNLNKVLKGFDKRVAAINGRCGALLDEARGGDQTLDGFEEIIDLLGRIPLPPALMEPTGPAHTHLTLRDWIESKCKGTKLESLLAECRQQTLAVKLEKFKSLMKDCLVVSEQAKNAQMRDCTRVNDRLNAQEKFIEAANQHVNDQKGLAQSFVKNQETARGLHEGSLSHDAMFTLCESHVAQLHKMNDIAAKIDVGCRECRARKNAMEKSFHTRIRWLYMVERNIADRDKEITLFQDRLIEFRHKVDFLARVQIAPKLYFALIRECSRRRTFAHGFTQWTDGMLATSRVARDREIVKRRNFKSMIGSHFILKLFPGFSDKPPSVAKRPLRRFDTELPAISDDDVKSITGNFPQFCSDEMEASAPSDLAQFPWQLTYSTSTKTMLTLQAGSDAVQNRSVTSSINSVTTNIEASVGSPSEGFLGNVKAESNDRLLGGFVTSSLHQLDDVTTRSPPTLPSGCDLQFGSPNSGEFFSMGPFSDASPKMQSFITITPPQNERFSVDMTTIEEDTPVATLSKDTACYRSTSQSQTTNSTSDDEMFHSFHSDLEKDKADNIQLLIQVRELQLEKKQTEEELERMKKKYEEDVSNLQRSRDEVVADFDRRWAESKSELSIVIGQLESERQERKQAWEKEATITQQCKEWEGKSSLLLEENSSLRSEILAKNEVISDMKSEVEKQRSSCEIEMADASERFERELWEMKQKFDIERQEMAANSDKLTKQLEERHEDVISAEDRIQELESELSQAEREIMTEQQEVEDCQARISLLQVEAEGLGSKLESAKMEAEEAKDRAADSGIQLKKCEERAESLKAMMAGYEMQLESAEEKEKLCKHQQDELESQKNKIKQLEENLQLTESSKMRQEAELSELKETALDLRATLASKDQLLNDTVSQLTSAHEQAMLEAKNESDERLNKMFNANKKKICEISEEHKLEVERLKDAQETEVADLKRSHRYAMDEMQADHIHALVTSHKERDQMEASIDQLNDDHRKLLDELMAIHSSETDRLKKELEEALQLAPPPQAKLTTSACEPMMTSSVMSSSNDEEPDGKQQGDDVMITSFKEELEREKAALKNSFKRKEESATKRRQVMFNSAIQHLTIAKDVEIQRLKEKLSNAETMMSSSSILSASDVTQSMTSSPTRLRDKVAITNFQRDDIVLVVYEEKYNHHIVFTVSHTLHFVHVDASNQHKLKTGPSEHKNWTLARYVHRDYCQVRKANNRFKVPVGTKFFRVYVVPLSKST